VKNASEVCKPRLFCRFTAPPPSRCPSRRRCTGSRSRVGNSCPP
jgi:hypothetical protein